MTRRKQRNGSDGEQDDMLSHFVALFKEKGWLNRRIRIRRGRLRYRIFCSDTEFLVYRINDNPCLSPGAPGWPVYQARQGRAFHDSAIGPFSSPEPDAGVWLHYMTQGDFEAI